MSKYTFIKINDEPNYDPNQLEYGYSTNKQQGGNHNYHNFNMTIEQENALEHIVLKYGIDFDDIKNNNKYKNLDEESKIRIENLFVNKKKDFKQIKYYYSKALYEAFPNKNNENQTFEHGIVLIYRTKELLPITKYMLNPISKPFYKILEDLFIEIRGERNDVDYIKNAKNNANTFLLEGERGYQNNIYNPYLKWIVETYKELFPKAINKILPKFRTLKNIVNYIGNFPYCNEEESKEIRNAIKKYIENYGKNLAPYFKEKIKEW